MIKIPYKIYSNCVFVHGYKNSTLCDLYRLRYKSMPIDLAKIIESLNGVSPLEYSKLVNSEILEFESFLYQLEKENYIHFIPTTFNFQWPSWEPKYCHSGCISSAILNIKNTSNYSIVAAIKKMAAIGCESINIIIQNDFNFEQLILLINEGGLNTSINNIEIYSKSNIYISDNIIKLLKTNKRYSNFYFSEIENPERISELPLYNFYRNLEFTEMIDLVEFRVNPLIYNESLKYNTYYHEKLIINENGEFFI